jgi:hypothetical protein
VNEVVRVRSLELKDIAAANGVVVAVGGRSYARILTSSDGVEWRRRDVAAAHQTLQAATYADRRFVAVGNDSEIVESGP